MHTLGDVTIIVSECCALKEGSKVALEIGNNFYKWRWPYGSHVFCKIIMYSMVIPNLFQDFNKNETKDLNN